MIQNGYPRIYTSLTDAASQHPTTVADLPERGDQNMSKRRNLDAGFKACVALEAVKGERTVSELAAEYGLHPTMIH